MNLPEGLYDLLVTEGLAAQLDRGNADVQLLQGDAADLVIDAITRQLAAALDDVSSDKSDRAARQLALANDLLVLLRRRLVSDGGRSTSVTSGVDLLSPPARLLRAVGRGGTFRRRPRLGCPCHGCLLPARARPRCCTRFGARWRPAITSTPDELHHRLGRAQASGRLAARYGRGRRWAARPPTPRADDDLYRSN